MTLTLLPGDRLKKALQAPASAGIELLILLGLAALVGALVMMARQVSAPLQQTVEISLSLWMLPKYTLMSLLRGFGAYILSLVFTLIYGTIAAHNHRAERVMIPALDVLQAIPVLGFLPGLVLALVHLFPTREIGLEISCVIMIFTAQVWNMTFSFHGSLRGIPQALREAAAIQRLSGWQIFTLLEVPASMIGLVWNSMMSMAGGWFFLTVNEAFTLKDHDYRLPGIGSYMNEAINRDDTVAMLGAIVAMSIMIIVVDQLFWRPVVAWAHRFKLDDAAGEAPPRSWALDLLKASKMIGFAGRAMQRRRKLAPMPSGTPSVGAQPAGTLGHIRPPGQTSIVSLGLTVLKWFSLAALAVGMVAGAWSLLQLLIALPLSDPKTHEDWGHVVLALLASFLRTSASVVLGAAWALPAGILIGLSPRWSQRLQPVIQVVASFPAPMLFPLVTMALALANVPFTIGCVALMLLGSQWYILFNVVAGATAIPADLKEAAFAYGMSRGERWKRLYLPSVFPYLVTGLVTAAGGAWNATIVSEYLVSRGAVLSAFGLGSTISHATTEGNFPLLAASVITMALFVVLLNRVLWKRLYRIAESRFSLNA